MNDKVMDMIIELLKDTFENSKLLESFYDAKNTINKLGLNYDKIHACLNNCIFYWGKYEGLESCEICNTSRWKNSSRVINNNANGGNKR